MAEPGTLYVVGTPIGTLADLSARAADILRSVDVVAAEDTRHTRKLLSHLDAHPRMIASHEHNESGAAEKVVALLREGRSVALVSDAGMPAVSDPGAAVVRAVAAAELPMQVVPGPSAVTAAVALSGWGDEGFTFLGFLPRSGKERIAAVEMIRMSALPVVVFESPKRVVALLRELSTALEDRAVAVCRELSKVHEEVLRGAAGDLAETVGTRDEVRGEFVIVISANPDMDLGQGAGRALQLDPDARDKDTAHEIGSALGIPVRDVYKFLTDHRSSRR